MNRITRLIRVVRQMGPRAGIELVQDRLQRTQREAEVRQWLEKYAGRLPSEKTFFAAMGLDLPKNGRERALSLKKLDETLRSRFMPSFLVPNIADHVRDVSRASLDATLTRAEEILAGVYSWLVPGYPDEAGTPKWFVRLPCSPETVPDEWPLDPAWILNEIDENTPSDIRMTWELGRHQFLVSLGRAWTLTRDAKYATGAVRILLDWIKKNPFSMGIHWLHAQEVALRLKSWLWVWGFVSSCPEIQTDERLLFYQSLWQHAEYVVKTRSRGRTTHNHMLTEWAGIAHFGLTFPHARIAKEWKSKAIERFENEITKQFWEDGAPGEGSSGYHLFVLENSIELGAQCRHVRQPVDDRAQTRVRAMLEFASTLFRPDGTYPRIGDVDDGRGFRLSDLHSGQDRRGVVYVGNALLRVPNRFANPPRTYEEEIWMLGPNVVRKRHEPPKSRQSARMYERSGIAVIQFPPGDTPATSHLVFCGGPEAIRSGVSASHHHADSLQVVWWRRGYPVLVDMGTPYYGGPLNRRTLPRRTRSHNAPTIGGHDRFDVTSQRFGVGRIPNSVMMDWEVAKDWCCVGFRVPATTTHPTGILLQRHVLCRANTDYLVIVDRCIPDASTGVNTQFQTQTDHLIQHFHLAPSVVTPRPESYAAHVVFDVEWFSQAEPIVLESGSSAGTVMPHITNAHGLDSDFSGADGSYGRPIAGTTVDLEWKSPYLPNLVWTYIGPPLSAPALFKSTDKQQTLTLCRRNGMDIVEFVSGVPRGVKSV
ncbi:MAG: heparinase II/III family protein [Myxococcales bacterium]|nr:heparinase II/III family protein [Myxococcales bacterium]